MTALDETGYEGWLVIEQDRVLANADAFEHAVGEQRRNRAWLEENARW